jgi:cobaltochelatase CobT
MWGLALLRSPASGGIHGSRRHIRVVAFDWSSYDRAMGGAFTCPSDNPAEPFKKALAEATRVLADDPDLAVSYLGRSAGTGERFDAPAAGQPPDDPDEVLLARGTADALALRHKYHDAGTAAKYAPTGAMARDLMDAMETARCEAVGARDMPGTAGNIDAKIGNEAGARAMARSATPPTRRLPPRRAT